MSELNELLKSGEAKELLGKKEELARAANTEDGRKLLESLEKADLAGAIKRGDTKAVRSAVESAMRTKEGERFLRELGAALGKRRGDG